MKKKLPFLCLTSLLITLLVICSTQVSSQAVTPKCYVVVGAFKFKNNAQHFADYINEGNLNAQVKLNTYRSLYYVYTFESLNREAAKNELFKIREENSSLSRAWLYAGNFNGPHIPNTQWNAAAPPAKEKEMEQPAEKETIETAALKEDAEVNKPVHQPQEEKEITEPSWKVYVNAVNTSNFNEVSGDFLLFDAERNQQIRELKTHELLEIEDPNNRTNRVRVVSDVFGYHEIEHTFDLDEPLKGDSSSMVEMIGDTIVLNFKLQRLKQGDLMTMWKVYFFKDAAIMQEESIYQLNQLLDMMKENENMEIMIHGHTNGNSHGPVMHLDLDDQEFFSLNGSHEETVASAKKLSLYRAYTIQHWLIAQGLPEARMDIKGWGGKKMIYDKHDSQADKNVRVEIEITKE